MLSSLNHSYFFKGRKCRSAFKHGADWITWVTIFLYRFCLRGFKPWFLKQSLWRWPQNTMTDQRLFQYIIFIHKFINFSLKKKKTFHLTDCIIQLKSNILLYLILYIKIYLQNYELIIYILIIVKKWSDSLESQEI